MQNLIRGLQILNEYRGAMSYAEHDIIIINTKANWEDFDLEDIQELEELGWFWDAGVWSYHT